MSDYSTACAHSPPLQVGGCSPSAVVLPDPFRAPRRFAFFFPPPAFLYSLSLPSSAFFLLFAPPSFSRDQYWVLRHADDDADFHLSVCI